MALELYSSKAERKREGKKKERGQPQPCGEKGEGRGKRRAKDKNERGESLREREQGPSSPFYSGLGYLTVVAVGMTIPGYCQVTVRVESSQNVRSLGLGLCDCQSQNYGVGGSVVSGTCLWEHGSLFYPLQSFLLGLWSKPHLFKTGCLSRSHTVTNNIYIYNVFVKILLKTVHMCRSLCFYK